MEIGIKLKEAREAKNLSLDSVQETTKIQKRYLVAIEEGNFQILPGKFYARAFIKEYATAVGLDPNELLDEYKEEMPKVEEEENTDQYTRIQRSRRDTNSPKSPVIFSLFPTIIVILLVIGIFFAGWYFLTKTVSDDNSDPVDTTDNNEVVYPPADSENKDDPASDEGSESTDDTTTEEPEPEPEPEKVEPTLELVETKFSESDSPDSTFDLVNAGEEVVVKLESNGGESYLAFNNDAGKQYFTGMFNADNSPKEVNVTGDNEIYFNVGFAPELQISINGVKLEYPIEATDKMHQEIWVNIKPSEE
ncbi:helix-turn-helix domain-containing protein [Virgibacillus sp. DJP39]|uniref:helix-turn-helix domain-containing protein n=1 Tax=Virgibacillus sp. DJP39 TaxID=3409790 RepID=UPI003BB61773